MFCHAIVYIRQDIARDKNEIGNKKDVAHYTCWFTKKKIFFHGLLQVSGLQGLHSGCILAVAQQASLYVKLPPLGLRHISIVLLQVQPSALRARTSSVQV